MKTSLITLIIFISSFLIYGDNIKFERVDIDSPEKGLKLAKKRGCQWVGYLIPSIKTSKIGSYYYSKDNEGKSLYQYIYNEKPSQKNYNSQILFVKTGKKTEKVKLVNYYQYPEFLENSKVLWINQVEFSSSVKFIEDLYNSSTNNKAKKKLVTAIGIHGTSKKIFDFLKAVVNSSEYNKIRENGVFWIGCQKTSEAVSFLKKLVNSKDDFEIRKKAVFAISISKTREMIPVLIDIAETNSSIKIRKSAIFWLGQQAAKKISSKLEKIAQNDPNVKIRKAAIFALSQHPEGVDSLLRIVKNSKHLDAKKKAIFWLSQKDDERALEAIKHILEK